MKMICPHCGVKGSADDSLMGTKVKCPKCQGIFLVESEVLQPIVIEATELEQLQDSPNDSIGMVTDDEVEDALSELLGETDDAKVALSEDDEEIDKILLGEDESAVEDELIAVLSDTQEEVEEDLQLEDLDETLTVIEDTPEETLQEEAQVFEDDEVAAALHDVEEVQETVDEGLSLDDGEAAVLESEIDIDDPFDLDDESTEDEVEAEAVELDEESAEDLPEEDEVIAETEAEVEDDAVAEAEAELEDEAVADTEAELEDEAVADTEAEVEDEAVADADTDLEEGEGIPGEEEAVVDTHIIRKCAACHEYVNPYLKYEYGDYVYCSKCLPPGATRHEPATSASTEELPEEADESGTWDETTDPTQELTPDERPGEEVSEELATAAEDDKAMLAAAIPLQTDATPTDVSADLGGRFTLSTLIKDAFNYSKGAKGSIWGAIVVMSLILGGLWGAGLYIQSIFYDQGNSGAALLTDLGTQVIFNFISFLFTAGILVIALRRVAQEPFTWKMLFAGFNKFGSVLLLYILMSIMLFIGFILFILPGIYLTVGYILALPLLLEKNLSPWQALERSRIAIHSRWWTVFFTMIALSILTALSAIPLGIGLIWTIPMFSILIAVLYYLFFGAED